MSSSSSSAVSSVAASPAGELFGLPMPMAGTFALQGLSIGDDRAEVSMPYQAAHSNSRGDVHGGAINVLFDCTLASAARSHAPTAFGVVTIDLTVHFIAPCAGEVIATAFCERRGKSISFVRGEARDAQGQLLALATGTFKLVARAAAKTAPTDGSAAPPTAGAATPA